MHTCTYDKTSPKKPPSTYFVDESLEKTPQKNKKNKVPKKNKNPLTTKTNKERERETEKEGEKVRRRIWAWLART